MERVLGGTDKIILNSTGGASGGVVLYISLDELMKRGESVGATAVAAATHAGGSEPMRPGIVGGIAGIAGLLTLIQVHTLPNR